MSCHSPADIWQQNLDALRSVAPEDADRLACLPIPDFIQPATGRDGSATWRICREEGRVEWFGRTSMPTISAESLLAGFNPGPGNLILAGIGSGREAQRLSERLGRHRATVVLETDPLHLALALRLWDMATALRNRQIALLSADDLTALQMRLLRFCQENPGFELPSRMLGWPWRSRADNQAYLDLVEAVARELTRSRGQLRGQLLERLQTSCRRGVQVDAVAVLTMAPGTLPCRLAGWLAEGARAAGLAATACGPDSPLAAGPLAGMAEAAKSGGSHGGQRLILLEHPRAHWPLEDLDAPLVSWLVSADPVGDEWRFQSDRSDLAVVSTDHQRERLLEGGWPASQVVHVPAFVTPGAFEIPLEGPREGILLLSDLPPQEAEAAGVTLYSHQVLWESLRRRLDSQDDTWTPQEAQRWLLAAQSSTGIDLADETVQEEFLGAIRTILAPAVILRGAARAILDAGLPLRLAGRGWDGEEWAEGRWDGPADDPRRRLELLARAEVALVGNCPAGPAWPAVEAAAAGAAIMARDLWTISAAELFEADREMLNWRSRQGLIERLRGLLRHKATRLSLAQRARQRAKDRYDAGIQLRRVLSASP